MAFAFDPPADPFADSDKFPANGSTNGASIEERAQDLEVQEDADGQRAFVVEEGGKTVTLAQLIRRGVPTEVRYKMTGKSIPNVEGGLLDPYATSTVLAVDSIIANIRMEYIRDENQKVEGVIQYVTLKPRQVYPAASEAGREMLDRALSVAAE